MTILGEFLGTVCVCGAAKRSRQSHCSTCYRALPRKLQGELYRRFGSGYEPAFEESVAFLENLRKERHEKNMIEHELKITDAELRFIAAACRAQLEVAPGQGGRIDSDEQRSDFQAAKTLLAKIQARESRTA